MFNKSTAFVGDWTGSSRVGNPARTHGESWGMQSNGYWVSDAELTRRTTRSQRLEGYCRAHFGE
jgi:hypothetical protein